MTIESYRKGKKEFSHTVRVGDDQIVMYFAVDMREENIEEFTKILSIKNKVSKFYACVVLTNNVAPRTFIAYRDELGIVTEMFNISTGIPPVELLKAIKGGE